MGDLKTENTSYPAALDTATLMADNGSDEIVAAHQNGPNSAILAIETELGLNPAGSLADLATRLNVNIHADGGLRRGTEFPASPDNTIHLFYRTDLKRLYVYNIATASYDVIPTTVTLSEYVEKATANTITAAHTFSPAAPGVPFVLAANAQGQTVTGLSADTVDTVHASSVATANCLFPLGANKELALPTPSSSAKHTINGVEIATVAQAVTQDENRLKIIRGAVSASGAVTVGSGFTVTSTATGCYTISFSSAFAGTPTVVAVERGTIGVFHGVVTESTTAASIEVFASGTHINSPFNFIAIGPK